MKHFLTLFQLIIFFKMTATSQTPNTGNVWLVAVSVHQYYEDSLLKKLDFPIYGAHELTKLYSTRQLTYSAPLSLIDRNARRSAIIKAMENTFVSNSEIRSDDMIIFFFSGHGTMVGDSIGICPYDYSGDVRDLITEQTIENIMRRSPARHKVCFIEACRNKVQVQKMEISDNSKLLEKFNHQRRNVGSGLVFINSSEAYKTSEGDTEIGGYFSYFLLKGLEGKADVDNNGFVTIEELFPFVRDSVIRKSHNQQTPQINEKGYDPKLPLIIVPAKLRVEKPQVLPQLQPRTQPQTQPDQDPCATNQTGEVCFQNATGHVIIIEWGKSGETINVPKGGTECLESMKAGVLQIHLLGTSTHYRVDVKTCDTVTKIIR